MYKYFKKVGNTGHISEWKSKGLSDEIIKTPSTPNNILNPLLAYDIAKTAVKSNGSCLNQDESTFIYGKIVNIYIVYEVIKNTVISSYPTLKNCLFGAVELTKDPDIDKYKYSGYGIVFDRKGKFSTGNGFVQNVIIFGVDMSSYAHANNKNKNILILGESLTQGLDNTTSTAEKKYSINFTATRKKLYLGLNYNGANSYLFVTGTEIIKFKTEDSLITVVSLCLGNISKDFSMDKMMKTGLNGYLFYFSVDYNAIAVDDIQDIR